MQLLPSLEHEPAADVPPSDNLYVKGLLPGVTEAQLNHTFSQAGQVIELKILRYGESQECVALIRMESIEAATTAINMLDRTAPEGSVPTLVIQSHGPDPTVASDSLYVKGLPLNFPKEHVQMLFGRCGTVKRCRVLSPPPNHAAPDSAVLVQMSSVAEARQVIEEMNGRAPEGIGPQMVIRYAEPKAASPADQGDQAPTDNLYIKGLPLGTPEFLLRAIFSQFGVVARLKVLKPHGGEGEALDCAALVQMQSVDEAKVAVEALHGRVLAAPLPPMSIRYAGKDKDQQPGCNLYVARLPIAVREQQLRATFSQCGTVVRLRLLVQPGRPETHALVQMSLVEEAALAITKLHGTPPDSLGPTLVVRYATARAISEKDAYSADGDGNEAPGWDNASDGGQWDNTSDVVNDDHPADDVPPTVTDDEDR